ncbi:MAG: hypothetical protein ABMA15_16340 [Vicinamibacterales bacterium]
MIETLKTVSAAASVVAALAFGGDEASDKAVALAREALSRQLGTVVDGTAALDVVAVSWPDSSLGCPKPGMMYSPVLLSGHRVRLRVRNVVYVVNVGAGEAVVCGQDASPDGTTRQQPSRAKTDSNATTVALGLRLAEQARTALASRLEVARSRITIDSYRAVTWPDANLGCPSVGEPLTPQRTEGFLIQLRVGSRPYPFHSDLARVVECPPRQ